MVNHTENNKIHILVITLIITFSFFYYNSKITYNFGQLDFFWSPSMHYAYSNIFKEYFFDFFNSFNLYDTELGFNHIYYPFSPLNPFYSLSIFGLEDYAINASNLFAIFSAAFFLFRISKILNLSWPKTYLVVLIPITHVCMYGYAFNQASINSLVFIWLYVLFYFDLQKRSVNYSFYIFFLIFTVLTSNFFILFNLIILFFILLFFYKFKKEHISDLAFFITANIVLWSIVVFPYFLSKTTLAKIDISNFNVILFLVILTFLIIFFFLKQKVFILVNKIYLFLSNNNNSTKLILIFFFVFLFLLILKVIFLNNAILLNLFKPSKTYNVLTFFYNLDFHYLINQVKIKSGVFLYFPLGLLIFTLITCPKKLRGFKIPFILIIFILALTYIINSEFFYTYTGARYLRVHLNYIPIIILLYIFLNFYDRTDQNKSSYFLIYKNIKINKSFLLPLAFIIDFKLILKHNIDDSYLYLIVIYLPSLILLFKDTARKKYAFLTIIPFFIFQPFINAEIVNNIGGGFAKVNPNPFSLSQYNDFMECYRDKSGFEKFDRVLATSTSNVESGNNSSRFKSPILVMLTERERTKDINVLFRRIEINYYNLFRTYNALADYKYVGKYKWSPVFYNIPQNKYFFNDNYFDQLGIPSVIVFNDTEKKFQSKYKSFKLQGTCNTNLYKADIYKSIIPRSAAMLIDKNNEVKKLKYISKNSWDISMFDQSLQDKFILKFAQYPETKIFIDNKEVDFNIVDGNIEIPFKKGNILEILYQNHYHRLHFILVNFLYFIALLLFFRYFFRNLKVNYFK